MESKKICKSCKKDSFIRNDGYVNITQLCKMGGKDVREWKKNKRTDQFIQLLSAQISVHISALVISTRGGCCSGTWGHPRIATHIANWISVEFEIKMTGWIDDWKIQNEINRREYSIAINSIKPEKGNDNKEKLIQVRMHKELGGDTEVETDVGYIDLLTKNELIEIKIGSKWKNGIGQLYAYSKSYKTHTLRLHLFDTEKNLLIEDICGSLGILVTYEPLEESDVKIPEGKFLCKFGVSSELEEMVDKVESISEYSDRWVDVDVMKEEERMKALDMVDRGVITFDQYVRMMELWNN
jgi:hypothetical protein